MTRIGIVGLGLIGGSLALRARAADPAVTVVGLNHRPDAAHYALAHGIVDRVASTYAELTELDVVFVCTPIPQLMDTLIALDSAVSPDTILTDVGSLKCALWQSVAARRWRCPVVLGHPMAGKAVTGIAAADADLLIDKTYILVESAGGRAPLDRLTQCLNQWGLRVVQMTARAHDRMVGYASHLPYLAAILGAGMAHLAALDADVFRQVAASGFRDTTRVAGSDPSWGASVVMGNSDTILEGLQTARRIIDQIETAIVGQDHHGLQHLLADIGQFRRDIT